MKEVITETNKVAILAPVNITCGIASYAAGVHKQMQKEGINAQIIEVPPFIYNKYKPRNRRATVEKKLITVLKEYKYINIQFEPGVFGLNKLEAYRFLFKICSQCKASSILITCHYIDVQFPKLKFAKNLVVFGRSVLKYIFYTLIFKKIIKLAKLPNVKFILHRNDYTEDFKDIFKTNKAFTFPLTCASLEEYQMFRKKDFRSALITENNLKKENKYIGMFGFLGPYKGYDIFIEALHLLPPEYHLILSSTIHPNTVKNELINQNNYGYIDLLRKIINKKSTIAKKQNDLANRVHYINFLDEQKFKETLAGCDYIVLPYRETTLHGSGPMSYAFLNKNSKILISNTTTFTEFSKFYKNCCEFFNIAFIEEIVYKITHWNKDNSKNIDEAIKKYNLNTAIGYYMKILKYN